MKINFNYNEINIEITYNENGYLDTVKNTNTEEYFIIESRFQGRGIEIKKEQFLIGGTGYVCDARYVRIVELDIFIPRFIFIKNN